MLKLKKVEVLKLLKQTELKIKLIRKNNSNEKHIKLLKLIIIIKINKK